MNLFLTAYREENSCSRCNNKTKVINMFLVKYFTPVRKGDIMG